MARSCRCQLGGEREREAHDAAESPSLRTEVRGADGKVLVTFSCGWSGLTKGANWGYVPS